MFITLGRLLAIEGFIFFMKNRSPEIWKCNFDKTTATEYLIIECFQILIVSFAGLLFGHIIWIFIKVIICRLYFTTDGYKNKAPDMCQTLQRTFRCISSCGTCFLVFVLSDKSVPGKSCLHSLRK